MQLPSRTASDCRITVCPAGASYRPRCKLSETSKSSAGIRARTGADSTAIDFKNRGVSWGSSRRILRDYAEATDTDSSVRATHLMASSTTMSTTKKRTTNTGTTKTTKFTKKNRRRSNRATRVMAWSPDHAIRSVERSGDRSTTWSLQRFTWCLYVLRVLCGDNFFVAKPRCWALKPGTASSRSTRAARTLGARSRHALLHAAAAR